MSDLFESHKSKSPSILLVDASGSVMSSKIGDTIIFDRIKNIINEMEETEFRIIFWNSNKADNPAFKNGVKKLPFVVNKSTLAQAFGFVKKNINNSCLTFPHLAFDNITEDWINNVDLTKIYLITDGEMGYHSISLTDKLSLKTALGESITRLFKRYNNIQLSIITVEPINRDFMSVETLQNAAGCDVYRVIMENKLTKYVSKFISYTPNNADGFVHINRNIPPPGFIPFGDKFFSELKMNQFIKYLSQMISETTTDDSILQIVQNLSSTVGKLTKDRPKKVVDDIIQMFCSLFNETSIDIMFVRYILTDAVSNENEGTANVYASYRSKLKDLYKQAGELVLKNVKDAIGMNKSFVSFPIENRIISGNARLVDTNIKIDNVTYPSAGVSINGIMVPVFPMNADYLSQMNEQCLRQWIRVIVSRLYNVNKLDDMIIYVVLATTLNICISDLDENIKEAYRTLSHIMLKKKRTNTDITELENLTNGELPIPGNGKIDTFYSHMTGIGSRLGLELKPMTIWYILCLALNNEHLINKQLIHCIESIKQDFGEINVGTFDFLSKIREMIPQNFVHFEMPYTDALEYYCLICLENTSSTGGYRFLPHRNIGGSTCSPIYVLSETGYQGLMNNDDTSVCPICYTQLSELDFERVGPKPASTIFNVFDDSTPNVFVDRPQAKNDGSNSSSNVKNYQSIVTPKRQGTIIFLKGVVGAGKSTYSKKIEESVRNKGGCCIVVGTDKYCKNGFSLPDAVNKIKEEFSIIDTVLNDMLVIVIDTCGEKDNADNIFGYNFRGWKKINLWVNYDKSRIEQYLAWTIRNVLRRTIPTADDNHWLNPDSGSVELCKKVHATKTKALFGKRAPKLFEFNNSLSKKDSIARVNNRAEQYQQFLDSTMPIDSEVAKLMDKI